MDRLEILSKFTTEELLNPITRQSVMEALGESEEVRMVSREDIEHIGGRPWIEELLDEKEPYREYKDQEIRELNAK